MPVVRLALVLSTLVLVVACEGKSPGPSPSPSPATNGVQPLDQPVGTPASPAAAPAPASGVAPAPAAPAAAAAQGSARASQANAAVKEPAERLVNMLDSCEPDSFNQAIGPGSCVRSGGLRFDLFIAELTKHGVVGSWRFTPTSAKLHVGDTIVAVNRGGEEHTFTEVAQFGGGIVPPLNDLSHNPEVAPECAALEDEDIVEAGGTYRETVGEAGTKKFQCCIHPWMRLEAEVSPK